MCVIPLSHNCLHFQSTRASWPIPLPVAPRHSSAPAVPNWSTQPPPPSPALPSAAPAAPGLVTEGTWLHSVPHWCPEPCSDAAVRCCGHPGWAERWASLSYQIQKAYPRGLLSLARELLRKLMAAFCWVLGFSQRNTGDLHGALPES